MKKRFFSLILTLCMVATMLPAVSLNASAEDTALTSGATIASGTTYTISNAEQLGYLAAIVNGGQNCYGATFKLTGKIDLNVGMTFNTDGTYSGGTPTSWTPIGNFTHLFHGTFDGGGYTVSGIYINDGTSNYQGLFGYVNAFGVIKNVGTVNSYICGNQCVGGVVGFNDGVTSTCFNSGTVTGTVGAIGGVVGSAQKSVTNCYNSGNVSGGQSVGGVVGASTSGEQISGCYNTGSVSGTATVGGVKGMGVSPIINCFNTGTVTATDSNSYVGGITSNCMSITNCYNSGSVTGMKYVGGVAANVYDTRTVQASYNTGSVNGDTYVGGITGNNAGTISSCYYDKQMCTFGGINGNDAEDEAEGKLTTEMAGTQLQDASAANPWGSDNWEFSDSLYPRIKGTGCMLPTSDAAYVSAAPVFLNTGDTVSSVTKNFTVGAGNSVGWNSDNLSVISITDKDASIVPGGTAVLTATCGNASKTVPLKVANVFVTLKKDGVVWTDSGYTLKLRQGMFGSGPLIDMTDTGTGVYAAAANANDSYIICDGATHAEIGQVNVETTGSETLNYYSVTYTGNHISFYPKPTLIMGTKGLTLLLTPDSGYTLPSSINVTMSGNSMTPGWDGGPDFIPGTYYYNAVTGEFKTLVVNGAISISAGLSSNATLTTILTKTVSVDEGLGTALAPKTASISVANTVASVTTANILPTDTGAAVTFYGTDSTFGTPSSGSISLTAGSGTVVYVKITAADSTAMYYAVTINRAAASGGGSGGGNGGSGSTATAGGTIVIVNDSPYTAGTSKDTIETGKKVTQVTVDTDKLQTILAAKGQNASVVIPVTTGSQVAAGVLTGQMVKNMETKEATLEIQTNSATYTLPASQINIDAVSKQLGASVALSDIQVNVQIAEPSDTTVKVVKNAATNNSFSIMVPAVDFSISCTHNSNTVVVLSFNSYVERTIAVPDGVDPTKITTGIVVNPDGTTRHVPTKVTVVNGKYYATINSLTNSTYAVIWHPIEFADVTKHWAKDAINDMGSRMVVNGVDKTNYAPNRDITRAEFAAIVVRALGLAPGTGEKSFGDVAASDWYYGYVKTASTYGIITGYNQTTFGPNDKITREQAMAMIARAMKITGLDVTLTDSAISTLMASYTDTPDASDYAKTSIAACLKTGIITGRSSSTVAPKENITRAEVAVIVQRLLQKSSLI